MSNLWFWISRRNRPARVRLVCLPHAGGGTVVYQPWARALSQDIEVWAAHLPGRESRIREPLVSDARAVTRALADAVAAAPPGPALAIYGHSMGAMLGYELSHELAQRGITTNVLMVSGRRAPHKQQIHDHLHTLPDQEFLQQLDQRYGGIPREVRESSDLMAIFLPILRADLRLVETYHYVERPPAPWPIAAFGGWNDRSAGLEDLEEWRALTTSEFTVEMFEGDHFFVTSNRDALLRSVERKLARWCPVNLP